MNNQVINKKDNSPLNTPGKRSVRNNLGYFAQLEEKEK